MNNQKYCVYCGKLIPSQATFCQYCGTKQPTTKDSINKQKYIHRKSPDMLKIGLTVIIILIIFGFAIGLVIPLIQNLF